MRSIPPRSVPMVLLVVWFATVMLVGGSLPLWLLDGGPSLCGIEQSVARR